LADLSSHSLADALDAFWNASIGEAHARQSSTAMDVACVAAAGFAAVAARLRDPNPSAPTTITSEQLVAFKLTFYGNTGDETDDPFVLAFAAIGIEVSA
jgi:hypothetical protein